MISDVLGITKKQSCRMNNFAFGTVNAVLLSGHTIFVSSIIFFASSFFLFRISCVTGHFFVDWWVTIKTSKKINYFLFFSVSYRRFSLISLKKTLLKAYKPIAYHFFIYPSFLSSSIADRRVRNLQIEFLFLQPIIIITTIV